MDDEFEADESGLDEAGWLDLFGQGGSGGPPVSAWDEEVAAGGDPADYTEPWEDCGDDEDAWLASLPSGRRHQTIGQPYPE